MRRKDQIADRMLRTYGVARVKRNEVKPVTDPVTCERAAIAYGRVFSDQSGDRKVHILRVGDRYIVMDPSYQPDDYHRAVTFDSTFTRPIAFVAE